MPDGSFVTAIQELAQRAAGDDVIIEVETEEITLESLSTIPLHRIPKELPPDEPAALVVHSLQGLVDYIEANRDELNGAHCAVHVVSPTMVRIVSKLQERAKRFVYLQAESLDLVEGWLGDPDGLRGPWRSLEETIIALQARFTADGDRARILQVLGNVTENAELQVEDDGISQRVTTRATVTQMKDESPVPNPVQLAPFRTFREVEQPVSPFVLRLRRGGQQGPQVALFEADGGAWELQAVEHIAAWLEGKVGDFAILH